MRRRPLPLLLALGLTGACTGSGGPGPARPPQVASTSADTAGASDVSMEIAPPFRVRLDDGTVLDSREVVGERALVLVFFATWCPYCTREMPLVRKALEGIGGDVVPIAVSLDGGDTFDGARPFLERYGLQLPLVRGEENFAFVRDYDPHGTIPQVVVVARDGRVVDVQQGHDPDHLDRLRSAIFVARLVLPKRLQGVEPTSGVPALVPDAATTER